MLRDCQGQKWANWGFGNVRLEASERSGMELDHPVSRRHIKGYFFSTLLRRLRLVGLLVTFNGRLSNS